MGEGIRVAAKWGLWMIIGYVVVAHLRPVYWEAWQAKKTADQVAAMSDGKTKADVKIEFLERLQAAGIRNIGSEHIELTRDGSKWDVGAQYEVARTVSSGLTLSFEFAIASDTKRLWLAEAAP